MIDDIWRVMMIVDIYAG